MFALARPISVCQRKSWRKSSSSLTFIRTFGLNFFFTRLKICQRKNIKSYPKSKLDAVIKSSNVLLVNPVGGNEKTLTSLERSNVEFFNILPMLSFSVIHSVDVEERRQISVTHVCKRKFLVTWKIIFID